MKRKGDGLTRTGKKRKNTTSIVLPIEIFTLVLPYLSFLPAYTLALTHRKLLDYFLRRLWPAYRAWDGYRGLTEHPRAVLTPSRVACLVKGVCEVCYRGRCRNVKRPWGVFAHHECIQKSILNRFYLREVVSEFDGASAMVSGYNPSSFYREWSSEYVWQNECIAFPGASTVDGFCRIRFGCSLEEFKERLRRERREREERWLNDHDDLLSQHPAWNLFRDRRSLWWTADDILESITVRKIKVRLTKLMRERQDAEAEVQRWIWWRPTTEADIVSFLTNRLMLRSQVKKECYALLSRRGDGDVLAVLDHLHPFPFSVDEARAIQMRLNNALELTMYLRSLAMETVKHRYGRSFLAWVNHRHVPSSPSDIWDSLLQHREVWTAIAAQPEPRFDRLPCLPDFPLQAHKGRPVDRRARSVTSKVCQCGNTASPRCPLFCCRVCCRGPCERHNTK